MDRTTNEDVYQRMNGKMIDMIDNRGENTEVDRTYCKKLSTDKDRNSGIDRIENRYRNT